MRRFFGLMVLLFAAVTFALGHPAAPQKVSKETFLNLSQQIWDWMAAKDTAQLSKVFHPNCEFVHMGGYWSTPQELQTIGSGGIWYKKATVYNAEAKQINANNWAVYSTMTLDAVVGGFSTSHPFFTTQIFTREGKQWRLATFVFTTRVTGPGTTPMHAPKAKAVDNPGKLTDMVFPLGKQLPEDAFHGEAYRNDLIETDSVFHMAKTNVITFAPYAHSNWHRHGGMDILVTAGAGIYQEEGKPAQIIRQGDVVNIPAGVRHWHGAAPGSWFQMMVIYDANWKPESQYNDGDNTVSDDYYNLVRLTEFPHANTHHHLSMLEAGDSLIKLPTFNGPVRLSETLSADNASGAPGIHNVVFEPGVYNAWHEHAGGQILIATDGIGYHQIEGQPVQIMHPGDVAYCPPGVRHWHGAAPSSRFAHLAINTNPDKKGVKWYKLLSKKKYDQISNQK